MASAIMQWELSATVEVSIMSVVMSMSSFGVWYDDDLVGIAGLVLYQGVGKGRRFFLRAAALGLVSLGSLFGVRS